MLVWRTFHRTDLWVADLGESVGVCSWAACDHCPDASNTYASD